MNVPRFKKHPIDTSVYNHAINWRSNSAYIMDIIECIRKAVKDITGDDPYLETGKRDKNLVTARQYFMHFVSVKTRLTQREVGALLKKDHATVVHANNCVNKFIENEPRYRNIYELIDNKLNRYIQVKPKCLKSL